jgi:hypothetical protein
MDVSVGAVVVGFACLAADIYLVIEAVRHRGRLWRDRPY